jgi:hypothetical protein
MTDNEMNDLIEALEAAYDMLRQPVSGYPDQSDFEARRQDAVEKLLRGMKVMYLDIDDDISDQPVFAAVTHES